MNRIKCHIKKDDKVKIIAGKDKGKIGKVLKIVRKNDRVLVEGINMSKRHAKPSAKNRQGGILDVAIPIQWSNVILICSRCMKPARTKVQSLESGKRVRACKKCGEIVDT